MRGCAFAQWLYLLRIWVFDAHDGVCVREREKGRVCVREKEKGREKVCVCV